LKQVDKIIEIENWELTKVVVGWKGEKADEKEV
jgi:hypothetical protein